MAYQVDQSGKIEDTAKDTVIAYSNGHQYAVLIPRKLKRKIQEVFRRHGFVSLFIYFLFAVGVYYAIKNIKERKMIIIDMEYLGRDKIIRSFLSSFLGDSKTQSKYLLRFARIGNKPKAHYAAKDVFDKKRKPDFILTTIEVVRALKKTDGRLRECLSTLVDARARSLKK